MADVIKTGSIINVGVYKALQHFFIKKSVEQIGKSL